MLRKIQVFLLCFVLIFVTLTSNVFAEKYYYNDKWNEHNEIVKLFYNNEFISTDVPSLIVDGRTLVPVRAFFENLGADVLWNDVKKEVTIQSDKFKIILGIDSYIAYVDGAALLLDVPAKIVADSNNIGRTLVPVRFISEHLGYKVTWNETTYSVYVGERAEVESITKITTAKSGLTDFITINLTADAKPVVTKIANPDRLILDFYDFRSELGSGSLNKSGVCFSNVRYANHDNYSRIVVDISCEFTYEVALKGNLCTVKLDKTGNLPSATQKPTVTAAPTPTPSPSVKPTPSTTPGVTEKPVAGSGLVVIDPGHGGSDPGALGYKDGEVYLRESDANLDISLKLYSFLKEKGVNVAMTRTTDVYVGLKERAEYANNLNASLFICVHNNSATTSAAHGSMVYYFTGAGDEQTKEQFGITSKELASLIHEEIIEHGGRYDRKIADGSKFVVLYSTNMPAILAECAFISNDEERELLNTDGFRAKIAEGICDGVIKALKQMNLYN